MLFEISLEIVLNRKKKPIFVLSVSRPTQKPFLCVVYPFIQRGLHGFQRLGPQKAAIQGKIICHSFFYYNSQQKGIKKMEYFGQPIVENPSPSSVITVPSPSPSRCHEILLTILLLRLEIKLLLKLQYLNICTSKLCYLHLLMLWNDKVLFKRKGKS